MNNPLKNIRIVLVDPQSSGNIGSVCRVMMNMGITDLAVIDPHERHDWDEARRLACHAGDLLAARKTYKTLAEALSDCTVVAGTSARTGMHRDHAGIPREMAPIIMDSAAEHQCALVFGREDTGLTNDELAQCTHIINIPSSEIYRSLNLSHAVMVCCYELFQVAEDPSYQAPQERASEANGHMREMLFSSWKEMMLKIGFCKDDKIGHMMLGLRRIFNRGKLTDNDVKILLGIARQSLWVAKELDSKKDGSS